MDDGSRIGAVRIVLLPLLALAVTACEDGPTGVPPEGAIDLAAPWHRVAPETVALDGNALFLAGERGAQIERLRSLLVVRDGRLAYERYFGGMGVDSLADVRSVTKSVVSALVGIAIDEGEIDGLDQRISDFLDDSDYAIGPEDGSVTIRHLLTMGSGWEWAEVNSTGYSEWVTSGDHVNWLLTRPFVADPGTSFTYNSAAVHLLGVILAEAVDRPLPEYADEVLFGPLGIRSRLWEDLSTGHVNGGAGLDLRPRDLARFGQLYLQEGWSGATAIMPSPWVSEATSPQWPRLASSPPIDDLTYGFLWWVDLENDAYFAWGYGGQFVYVMPRLDMVVVATTDWRGVSEDVGPDVLEELVLTLIVEHVLPAAG